VNRYDVLSRSVVTVHDRVSVVVHRWVCPGGVELTMKYDTGVAGSAVSSHFTVALWFPGVPVTVLGVGGTASALKTDDVADGPGPFPFSALTSTTYVVPVVRPDTVPEVNDGVNVLGGTATVPPTTFTR
jgi:hypothetical protein